MRDGTETRVANRWILFAVAIAIAVGSGLIFGKQMYTVIEIRDIASSMLGHLADGNYKEASRFIAYYEEGSEKGRTGVSGDNPQTKWISRMETVDAEVTGFENLEVWMEDGHPEGRVTLSYRQKGSEMTEQTPISFLKHEGEWKISGFPFLKNEQLSRALSGKINE